MRVSQFSLRSHGIAATLFLVTMSSSWAKPLPIVESSDIIGAAGIARSRAGSDTTYYGGNGGPGGIAVEGGVWDFEDGSFQGWSTTDQTDLPVFGRRVEAPFIGAITSNFGGAASTASLWIGGTQDEAELGCWPGGLGYSNTWVQRASKTLTYIGGGDVLVEFDYFVDSETQYDFTFVYVVQQGVRSQPLNTSAHPDPNTGFGYSGGGQEGTAIGSPSSPAHDAITVDAANFPFGAGEYQLQFTFESDFVYSDGLDFITHAYFDSEFGPFGVDAISVNGSMEGDFEMGTDGWTFSSRDPVGAFAAIEDLADLDPISDPLDCPLLESGNQYVLVTADLTAPTDPHPELQMESLVSNSVYVGDDEFDGIGLAWSAFADLPFLGGVSYRRGIHYYPWTCPTTSVVGWTIVLPSPGGYTFVDPASCASFLQDFSTYVPTEVDSVRVGIDILALCENSATAECWTPDRRNQTPYLDDLQLFTYRLPIPVEPDTPAPVPAHTRLLPVSPNPFNPRTTVRYEVSAETNIRLQVFDVEGGLMTTLLDERQRPGTHTVEWDGLADTGLRASSGVYWVRLSTSSGVSSSTKIVLLE